MPADAPGLAAELRRRLGPPPALKDRPLVSLVVPNRNGARLLARLVEGLADRTDYPRFELIAVDNGSTDDSLDFLRRVEAPFPISIVANPHNESFSVACNQGAELAHGDLLLFLNNDVEPFEPGWLGELVDCQHNSRAAAIAATLVCPDAEHEKNFPYGYGIQHRGLAFREEGEMIHPVLHGWEEDPLDDRLGEDVARGAVAAACVLVEADAFRGVGGFSHGYVYGVEDVDLCFKLRAAGLGVLCSGRSIAIHHPVSTRRTAPFEEERARKLSNRRVLWERWGPQLRREYELDRLAGGGIWAEGGGGAEGGDGAENTMSLSYCLKDADSSAGAALDAVAAVLRRRGHRCLPLAGERCEDPIGLNYDVAVHVLGRTRYLPKSAQLNVLWNVADGADPGSGEHSRFDLTIDGEDPGSFAAHLPAAAESRASEIGFRRRIDRD